MASGSPVRLQNPRGPRRRPPPATRSDSAMAPVPTMSERSGSVPCLTSCLRRTMLPRQLSRPSARSPTCTSAPTSRTASCTSPRRRWPPRQWSVVACTSSVRTSRFARPSIHRFASPSPRIVLALILLGGSQGRTRSSNGGAVWRASDEVMDFCGLSGASPRRGPAKTRRRRSRHPSAWSAGSTFRPRRSNALACATVTWSAASCALPGSALTGRVRGRRARPRRRGPWCASRT
mmetsp:Transcript_160042/g.509560  ORF Transcript_160042/g.509560 Transcript_160042/m.509560 type:complete len:234 (-) Transcript_160042:2250-2951(-)